jgi:DNA-binding response OmpR family regulator
MRQKRVLIIDRSRTIQLVLSTNLRNAGYEVLTCGTPKEALGLLAGPAAAPDIIIVAIDFAKEAYKVIQYVKEHLSHTPIRFVAVVLPEEMQAIQRTLKEAPVDYLVKPYKIQEVLKLVSAPLEPV